MVVVPFATDFFQNVASRNYLHTFYLPDVRVIAAEFYVTNSFGPSQTASRPYAYSMENLDQSLRTLSGGQVSLQVSGFLATQHNAAPPFLVEASHAVRDFRATVNQAPNGFDISVQVLQNGHAYGSPLTILSGATSSIPPQSGANLPPLVEADFLTIDVALNPSAQTPANAVSPGRDLTVTIRL
jgi:hypothetical protein